MCRGSRWVPKELTMVLPIPWFMTALSSVKCVPGGCLRNWQKSVRARRLFPTLSPLSWRRWQLSAANSHWWWNMWIHHYEPESKRQSVQWKHPSSAVAKKFKMQPSAGKVMLTVFWDSQVAYSGNLSGTWNNRHKWNVLWHASERTETRNPL